MTFDAEVCLSVTVEVQGATKETPGRSGDAPERCYPHEPESVELAVTLGGVDITAALPADVLDALETEALERLAEV